MKLVQKFNTYTARIKNTFPKWAQPWLPGMGGAVLVLFFGYFTYFQNYDVPRYLFWDENYYLTAVAKYHKGIFFQESHPPWGKLVMAAGEKLIDPNAGIPNDFEKDDYTKTLPDNYSFLGVRFFPTFFAWVNSGLFYALMISLTGSISWAVVLSFFYLFDNAVIVHSRAAMLDSIQLFGILLAFVSFFRIYKNNRFSKRWMTFLALGLGWAVWTKLNGLIVAILFPLMLLLPIGKPLSFRLKKAIPSWCLGLGVFLIWTVFVWQTHFGLGNHVDPRLQNSGWYKATEELKDIKLRPDAHTNPVENFFVELRDYFFYMKQYAAGVPKLDLCKVGENGSPFYWWPFGSRTINYRWESHDGNTAYLFLVPNPFSWGLGLLSIFLTFSYFMMQPLFKGVALKREDEIQLAVLFIFYLSYLASISRLGRVMYLYHYIIPLLVSFAIAAKWIPIVVEKVKQFPNKILVFQIILMIGIAGSWKFMSPFTYYQPINCSEFNMRALFNGWFMKGIGCEDKK